MSEPVVPQSEAPKKGLSTGAKIAIGCLIAVLLGIGGCVVFVGLGARWLGNKAEEFAKNPDAAAFKMAEMTMRANPEIEVLEADSDAGILKIRSKKDGKVITFNLDDIKSGKLSIEADGETVNIGVDTEGDDQGSMTIESSKGRAVFGAADMDSVPEWVPVYPGARTDGNSIIEANGEKSGSFTIHTSDDAEAVLDYYEQELEAAGFEVRKTTVTGSAANGNVNASADGRTVNVTVVSQEGETQGLVAFVEKP